MKRTVEIDDTLPEIVQATIDDVATYLTEWLDENHTDMDDEPDTPEMGNDLDYSGTIHEIIDSAIPIYTAEINDCFYLRGNDIEAAFDDAGIGEKQDDQWPCGWKAAAIYCYIEQQVNEWYHDNADDAVIEWWEKRKEAAK